MKAHSVTKNHLPTSVNQIKVLPKPLGPIIWGENDIGICFIYSDFEFLEPNIVFSSAGGSLILFLSLSTNTASFGATLIPQWESSSGCNYDPIHGSLFWQCWVYENGLQHSTNYSIFSFISEWLPHSLQGIWLDNKRTQFKLIFKQQEMYSGLKTLYYSRLQPFFLIILLYSVPGKLSSYPTEGAKTPTRKHLLAHWHMLEPLFKSFCLSCPLKAGWWG